MAPWTKGTNLSLQYCSEYDKLYLLSIFQILDLLNGCFLQVDRVACSVEHAAAITIEGSLFVWGKPERLPSAETASIFPWMIGPYPLNVFERGVHDEDTVGPKVGCTRIGSSAKQPTNYGVLPEASLTLMMTNSSGTSNEYLLTS